MSAPALHRALGGDDLESAIAAVNDDPPLLLLDTFEEMAGLARHLLTRVIPRLDAATRVVVAGRYPLVATDADDTAWPGMVTRMQLVRLDDDDSREYLRRRGVKDPEAAAQAVAVCGGNPLALTLAADLVVAAGANDLRTAGDWETTVRALTERLLRHISHLEIRELLEAAATVRTVDEEVLAAVSGLPDARDHFDDLARLAMLYPVPDGLRLHDDVRRILLENLERHRPQRRVELRERALAYYARRMAAADAGAAAKLVNERLYLWDNEVVHSALFTERTPGGVFLEAYTSAYRGQVLALWDARSSTALAAAGGPPVQDMERADMEALLDAPGNRTMLARRADGVLLAFGPLADVGGETEGALPAPARATLAEVRARPNANRAMSVTWMGPIVAAGGDDTDSAAATLIRGLMGIWVRGGVFFTATTLPGFGQILAAFGFTGVSLAGQDQAQGWVLDLPADQVDDWMRRIMAQLRPPPADPPGTVSLDVVTLGTFKVLRDGEEVTPPPGVPARAIKVVVAEGGSCHVERVAEALWPEVEPGRARARLSNVLSRVRERCGPLLVRAGDLVELAPEARVDADEFREQVDRALDLQPDDPAAAERLAQAAVRRYGGDLFPGEPYAHWAEGPRQQLRQRQLAALGLLAAAAERRGDADEALQHLQRGIELDPYDEARYLRAAAVLDTAGRRGRAARTVRQAEEMLASLGLEPSDQLRALKRELEG